jgi:transaldolase
MLWASTGTKDPSAPDTLYVEALAAPDTIDTMPDKTLQAFADHGTAGAAMALDNPDRERVIADVAAQGVDIAALATRLQKEGGESFSKSWNDLLAGLRDKTARLATARAA